MSFLVLSPCRSGGLGGEAPLLSRRVWEAARPLEGRVLLLTGDGWSQKCRGIGAWNTGTGPEPEMLWGILRTALHGAKFYGIIGTLPYIYIYIFIFYFFPNQAALEGFLQAGLRNRIGLLGGTGSPILHFGGSPQDTPRIPPGSPQDPPQDPPQDLWPYAISYGHRRSRMVHADKNKKWLF